MLIEEAGSGASLIQELHDHKIPAIAIRPEGDKVMRMDAQTAKIEAGRCICRGKLHGLMT